MIKGMPVPPAVEERAKQLLKLGLKAYQIAARLGISETKVGRIKRELRNVTG